MRREATREKVESIAEANMRAAEAPLPSAVLRINRDALGQIGHGYLLFRSFAHLHRYPSQRSLAPRARLRQTAEGTTTQSQVALPS